MRLTITNLDSVCTSFIIPCLVTAEDSRCLSPGRIWQFNYPLVVEANYRHVVQLEHFWPNAGQEDTPWYASDRKGIESLSLKVYSTVPALAVKTCSYGRGVGRSRSALSTCLSQERRQVSLTSVDCVGGNEHWTEQHALRRPHNAHAHVYMGKGP